LYTSGVNLSELLRRIGLSAPASSVDPEITGVALDSRLVRPGFVFCAAPGIPLAGRAPLDGHDFIAAALERGAAVVVGSRDLNLDVPYIRTDNPRALCAQLSSEVWGRPQDRLNIVGITGSKGKSTTVALVSHLLEAGALSTARMSTVGIRYAERDEHMPGHFTTPEAPQVYELLHRFADAGCTHAVLEVSSHALALERVTGIAYDIGVWVSFFPDDHIDFHGSEEAYFAAKRLLLERSRFGVLNASERYYPQFDLPHWSFGGDGDWRTLEVTEDAFGLQLEVASPVGQFTARVPMIGAFNALNVLAALAVGARAGLSIPTLQAGLESFPGVPGRMQILQTQPFRAINDFAHTGASLTAALKTLHATTTGRLIVVVGAAGQRDPARRSGIGAACAKGADLTVFTEEDHRTETLETILEQMRVAYLEADGHADALEVIPDRSAAIQYAVQIAQPGDTVLFAGKGHERTLERGEMALPWDENAVVRSALAKLSP
jgi:UDP-N-acetylmuramoyl-L-alanyl-D-glutamate--2,6-diaminopimelate ligase